MRIFRITDGIQDGWSCTYSCRRERRFVEICFALSTPISPSFYKNIPLSMTFTSRVSWGPDFKSRSRIRGKFVLYIRFNICIFVARSLKISFPVRTQLNVVYCVWKKLKNDRNSTSKSICKLPSKNVLGNLSIG